MKVNLNNIENLLIRSSIILAVVILLLTILTSCAEKKKSPPPPVQRHDQAVVPPGSRDIPYTPEKVYKYSFTEAGVDIGDAGFRITPLENGTIELWSYIDFANEQAKEFTRGEGTLVLDKNMRLISYTREMDAQYRDKEELNGNYSLDITSANGRVTFRTSEPPDNEIVTEERELPSDVFVFDNNFIGQMAYICSQPVLKSGRREYLDVLAVTFKSTVKLAMTPKIKHEMDFHGDKVIAYEVDMKSDGATFGNYYITPEGILIKAEEQGGFLLIELQNPD